MTRRGAWLLSLLSLLVLLGSAAPLRAEPVVLDDRRLTALAELPPIRGAQLRPAALRGKVVVVTFFASWCPPCRQEFVELTRAKQAFGKDLEVVAVNIFETFGGADDGARLERFLDDLAPPFILLGEGESLRPLFGKVDRIPTLFVFGPDGRAGMGFVHARGATKTHATYEELAAAIRALF